MAALVTVPDVIDVLGFVAFFFPGYISLNVTELLLGTETKDRSDLVTVVLSFFFSVFAFLPSELVFPGTSITSLPLNPYSLLLGFVFAVPVGLMATTAASLWLHAAAALGNAGIRIGAKVHLSYLTFDKNSSDSYLKLASLNPSKIWMLVETDDDQVYRGRLGTFSRGKLDLALTAEKDSPMQKWDSKSSTWRIMHEETMFFPEANIGRLYTISR